MVLRNPSIHFLPAEKKFEPILLTWFDKPHVQEFYYGDGLKSTLHNIKLYMQGIKNNGDYSFDHWIAFFDNQPFGFLMTSTIENGHEYFMKDASTMTLDLLIGEEAFLGKGLAVAMTQELILDKFSDTDYVLIDPSASNPKAIHVYEKAGFKKIADFIPSYDPIPHLMMRLTVQDLKNQISREHKNF